MFSDEKNDKRESDNLEKSLMEFLLKPMKDGESSTFNIKNEIDENTGDIETTYSIDKK